MFRIGIERDSRHLSSHSDLRKGELVWRQVLLLPGFNESSIAARCEFEIPALDPALRLDESAPDMISRTRSLAALLMAGAALVAQAGNDQPRPTKLPAGLLDGLSATTIAGATRTLATNYPKVHVVTNRRYVDNGKIITTAGLSAGIDRASHLLTLAVKQVSP